MATGYGAVVPNVRGSTGYGKRYASLDDTTKRLDSVQDLASVHGELESLGFDPGRAVLLGGSYGGYMVLAGLAFQPELWAAGVDIVGISDLVTFLENTSPYRRAPSRTRVRLLGRGQGVPCRCLTATQSTLSGHPCSSSTAATTRASR